MIWGTSATKCPTECQWRQCDAYSMALNYAMEPRGLFEPAIHFQHGAGRGGRWRISPDVFPQWKTLESDWASTLDPPMDPFGTFAPRLLVFVPDTEPVGIAVQFAGPNVVDDGLGAHGVLRPQLPRQCRGLELGLCGMVGGAQMVADRLHGAQASGLDGLGFYPGVAVSSHHGPRSDSPGAGRLRNKTVVALDGLLGIPVVIGVAWVVGPNGSTARTGVYFLTTIRPLWEAESIEATWRAFQEDVPTGTTRMSSCWQSLGWLRQSHVLPSNPTGPTSGSRSAGAIAAASWGTSRCGSSLNVHDYYLIELQWSARCCRVGGDRWKAAGPDKTRGLGRVYCSHGFAIGGCRLANAGTDGRRMVVRTGRSFRGVTSGPGSLGSEQPIWQRERMDRCAASQGIQRHDLVLSVTDPS